MKEEIKSFDMLTAAELYDIYRLRVSVFVVEQSCAYQEVDEADKTALHVTLRDDAGEIAAYCRVLPPAEKGGEALIGRVIAARRRGGLGTKVVQLGMAAARQCFEAGSIRVEAQTYALPFYEKLGFKVVSEEYLEDGIPHITMLCGK